MDGRQKSDAQSESANDHDNDEVIDLTQVIQEGNDDEIIDLTNVLDQPAKDPDTLKDDTDQSADTDDTPIDLEEPVSDLDAGKADDISLEEADTDDEEFIDLAEIEKTLEVDITQASLEDDEDIIGLMETAKPDASFDSDMADGGEDDDEDIINLMEAAKPDVAFDSDMADGDEDDDEDIINLMEAAKHDISFDSDMDDSDEISDLEPISETTVTDPLDTAETAEIIDLKIAGGSVPSPDENADDDIIDLAVMEEALEADLSNTNTDDNQDDEEEVFDLLNAVGPKTQVTDAKADDITDSSPSVAPLFADTLDSNEEIDILSMQDTENDEDLLAPDEYADEDEIIDLAEMETALDMDTADNMLEEDDHKEDEDDLDLFNSVVPETQPETKDAQDETIDEDLTLDTTLSEPSAGTTVPLSEDQIEAALERTIRNIYGEKIEQLMIQTIEKTVLREITKIKQALMENDDDVSN